jgi:uncharacterized BrkB/YihY/UPF0761 family membrane protein
MDKSKAPAGRAALAASADAAVPVRPDPPRSVVIAARLMYAGAAVTAIGLVISVIAVATGEKSLRANHPHATLAQLHATQNFLITIAVVSGLVEIAAWLFMARVNRAGLKWARIVASALFALSTWSFVSHLFGTITAGNMIYSAAMWLVGLGAVFFLWQKDSSAYFS